MATPAITLNLPHFRELLLQRGYRSNVEFVEATMIPSKTLSNVLEQKRELLGPTVAAFLNAFPGTSFEYLFDINTKSAA